MIYGPFRHRKIQDDESTLQNIEWDYPEEIGQHDHEFSDEGALAYKCSGKLLTVRLNTPPGNLSDPVVNTFNFITGNVLLQNSSVGIEVPYAINFLENSVKNEVASLIEQKSENVKESQVVHEPENVVLSDSAEITIESCPDNPQPEQTDVQYENNILDSEVQDNLSDTESQETESKNSKIVQYWDARPDDCGIPISKEFSESLSDEAKMSEKVFFKHLYARLLACGGRYSQEFFANIYVCLKSFPLNLISGPPGCGKSTLVRTLSAAMGHPHALLNIYVKRKWSDDRDLLGGYDGFNNRYNPGPSGLAKRLAWAADDWEKLHEEPDLTSSDLCQSFYTILMDEFNLAPPEYYFSSLLQNLDKECGNREITLFDKAEINHNIDENDKEPRDIHRDKIQIYDNIRFWGTINNDETTERLSPRLLDRTGMIFINPLEDTPQPTSTPSSITDEDRKKCVYAGRIVNWIKKPNPNEGIPKVFNEVMIYLGSKNLMPSKRVEKAINVYMANAKGILEEKQAADFVFQQRVIPLLQGRGRVEKFKETMTGLMKTLENAKMFRSAGHIERAIDRAGEYEDIDLLGY